MQLYDIILIIFIDFFETFTYNRIYYTIIIYSKFITGVLKKFAKEHLAGFLIIFIKGIGDENLTKKIECRNSVMRDEENKQANKQVKDKIKETGEKSEIGFWTWLGSSIRKILSSSRKKKILLAVETVVLIILVPILAAYIFDIPALVKVPFDSVDWFGYWASYLSLLFTAILDLAALFLALVAYNNENQYKKHGLLYINRVNLEFLYCGDNQYRFNVEMIDLHPNLTHHHEVSIENFEIYAVKNYEVFRNPDLLKNPQIKQQALDLIYSKNLNKNESDLYCQPKSSNERYSLILKFNSNEAFLHEYLTFKTFAQDKKMLYVSFDYKINTSIDNGGSSRFLKALFPSVTKRTSMFLKETETDKSLKTYNVTDEYIENITSETENEVSV